ncbi:helix-turn-helix domain-containing protein [Streptomyces sp. NPDC059994]|uniref:helix-turn-helix domain-containing protein n=1 Tax=Streptomyces sp. NPDC059994 TaxID=3347029 RepID=UPI0036C5BCA7
MARPVGVTARKLELGIRLRQLREPAGLTIAEAADSIRGLSEATLQRIERGRAVFRSSGVLRQLLERYDAPEDVVDELITLYKDAASQSWITLFEDISPEMQAFAGIESEARSIRLYHSTTIPALLQTKAYAQAQFEAVRLIEGTTSSVIRNNVELRMKRRQESILRAEDPPRLSVVLGQAALEKPLGDPEVMRGQYAEIAELASLEHVQVQVLPTRVWGVQFPHNFTVLELGERLPTTVQFDSARNAVTMSDKPSEVDRFTDYFQAMTASALPPADTPGFMNQLAREIQR